MTERIERLKIKGRILPLKHLDKIYSRTGKVLKAEVIEYYIRMGELILPHISDKPFSMIHFPEGVGGKSFYQKQCPPDAPDWLKTVVLPSSRRKTIEWCLVNDIPSMVYMANRSVIEMHTWFSRLPDLSRPDVAVIDLDPSGGTGFAEALVIARAFRYLLDRLGIYAVPKTSGSRGIHIMIPIRPMPFDRVQDFLNKLCRIVMDSCPGLATTERMLRNRGAKIYLDAVQNGQGKTIIAPYSLRAREGIPVSTPLRWEELDNDALRPSDFHIRNFADRLEQVGDLFAGFYDRAQELPVL